MKDKRTSLITEIINALILHQYPVSLIQFVTEKCNAKCPHCFVDFTKIKQELTLEEIEKIALTSGNCLRNIALTGGEPFIRDDLFEIADIWYKNSKTRTISITTNGSMPDRIEKFALKASKLNMPVSFFFSYDFMEEKHSEYRKLKDLHLKVLESYKIIRSNNLNATFQITVNPDNYDTAVETYKYMRDKLKIQNINCTMIRGEKADNLDLLTRQKISEVYKEIQIMLDEDFDCGKVKGFYDSSLTSILLNAKNKIIWKYVLKTFIDKKYISPCTAGSLFGVIYSDGSVFPCELLDTKTAKLQDYDYNFMKCWQSNNAKLIRNQIKKSKCHCTFECSWLVNIYSSPRYYAEILYNIVKNSRRKNYE